MNTYSRTWISLYIVSTILQSSTQIKKVWLKMIRNLSKKYYWTLCIYIIKRFLTLSNFNLWLLINFWGFLNAVVSVFTQVSIFKKINYFFNRSSSIIHFLQIQLNKYPINVWFKMRNLLNLEKTTIRFPKITLSI